MTAPTLSEPRRYRPDEPCAHPGCLAHHTHPCEGCGRIAGRYPAHPEPRPDDKGGETAPPSFAMLRAMAALRFDGDSLHYLTAMQVRQLGSLLDAFDTATSDVAYFAKEAAQLRRAPAPHPAPLGATDEGLREYRAAIQNYVAEVRRTWADHWQPKTGHRYATDFAAFLGERVLTDFDARPLSRAALQATP